MRSLKYVLGILCFFTVIISCEKTEPPETTSCIAVNETISGVKGFEFEFSSCSENATSLVWEFGDGTSSNDVSPSHVYDELGVYTVQLKAKGENGTSVSQVEVEYAHYEVKEFDFEIVEKGTPSKVDCYNGDFLIGIISENGPWICEANFYASDNPCMSKEEFHVLDTNITIEIKKEVACFEGGWTPPTDGYLETFEGPVNINLMEDLKYSQLEFTSSDGGLIYVNLEFELVRAE